MLTRWSRGYEIRKQRLQFRLNNGHATRENLSKLKSLGFDHDWSYHVVRYESALNGYICVEFEDHIDAAHAMFAVPGLEFAARKGK